MNLYYNIPEVFTKVNFIFKTMRLQWANTNLCERTTPMEYKNVSNLCCSLQNVLLHCPPGTGKTYLARAVVAKPSDLLQKYVGESESIAGCLFAAESKVSEVPKIILRLHAMNALLPITVSLVSTKIQLGIWELSPFLTISSKLMRLFMSQFSYQVESIKPCKLYSQTNVTPSTVSVDLKSVPGCCQSKTISYRK